MIVCRKTGEKMSAWKWMARICSKTPWMKTWSLRVYYWWKKLQYQKGYVEKEEINPKKVIFEAYMGKKMCVQSKSTVSGDVPGSTVSGLGADLGVPGTGEVSRDGAGAAYKSSSLSKRGILPCICIRKVLGDEFAASEGTAAERRAGIYSVLAWDTVKTAGI